ncbi:kinase-like domain-containing protein [Phycomyces nitens]|nr:kinase-like domain-containing protein [Phycomyces nitens]
MPPNITYSSTSNEPMMNSIDRLIEATPYIDIEVLISDLFEGAFKVISGVFPTWKRQDIKFVQCKDGITNQLVKVTHQPTDMSVLVRAYGKGSEKIIDRKQEIVNIVTLSTQKMCPPLYGRFRNGLVYGYIKGRVASVEDLGRPKTAKWIAQRLAKWHQVQLDTNKQGPKREQTLWDTMWNWLEQVPEKYSDPKAQNIFASRFNKKSLSADLKHLMERLEKLDSPIVFSHNDLLYGNIIFDDQKEEASFIDYEYGCYAFRGFDIGNHFNEFAGFECDYKRYPDRAFQLQWFEWYLFESTKKKPTAEALEHLYREVNGFSLASHFYWGLWAMIQATISDIDFDYMSYAVLRFDEYEKRKNQVFSL